MDGHFSFLRRRRFLKLGLGMLGVVGAGAGGLVALRGSAPSVTGLAILGAQQWRTLQNIAQAQLALEDQPTVVQTLSSMFDAFLADEPAENQKDLRVALHLVEYGPVIFERRAVTFSHLDDTGRRAHWLSWNESDRLVQRQVATAFRKFFSMVYFDQPSTWTAIGYPGPSLWGPPKAAGTGTP